MGSPTQSVIYKLQYAHSIEHYREAGGRVPFQAWIDGLKRSQQADIERAVTYWKDYQRRKAS
jgi:hypothetical protein